MGVYVEESTSLLKMTMERGVPLVFPSKTPEKMCAKSLSARGVV